MQTVLGRAGDTGETATVTILVDSRIGSKHLAELIPNSVLTQLDSADVCFEGSGVTIGVELKTVMDAVSCMYSGRLADRQIPLMKAQYDICYLVIEGVYRPCPQSGVLQYLKLFDKESEKGIQCGKWLDASSGRKRLMYGSFENWLSTLTLKGGLHLRFTPSPDSTAAMLASLCTWYQRESHHSFHVLDESTETAVLSRPTMLRRMIALLPRVGWDRSAILARRFTGVKFLPDGDLPEKWYIENQIAEGTARKIVEACGGHSKES